MNSGSGAFRGFLVHAEAEPGRDRLFFTGRLEDGRSFAAVETQWRPSFHIDRADHSRSQTLLASLPHNSFPSELESFSGTETLVRLEFGRYRDRQRAFSMLEAAGIASPDGALKPADAFLVEKHIRGPLDIRGSFRNGRLVDLVFPGPELRPLEENPAVRLKLASIDIETDTKSGAIRAIGLALSDSSFENSSGNFRGRVGVVTPEPRGARGVREPASFTGPGGDLVFFDDERSLLLAFIAAIQQEDPDVLTGWNFLDFDFPCLAGRAEKLGLPFALSRSRSEAKFFAPREGRSAAALVGGRQVIDALRVVRSGPERFSDYRLQTIARSVLGQGKTVAAGGAEKVSELDALYASDPEAFGRYCLKDAELVLGIFAKTGLFRLTMERAMLTGVSLDKAWTSVVSFERIYGMELKKRNIAPGFPSGAGVSGAAGGTVLESECGFFSNVAVFDFRSLYPTIIRTFNIDPLAHARAGKDSAKVISAPNGAVFSREPGILPSLIAEYFASRKRALEKGDLIAGHVYKILMNSFYGVLGTGSCRYGRTELAGAITSFAKKWLLLSRNWFIDQGYQVLYGDTDSLFVSTGLDDTASYAGFSGRCSALAEKLNRFLSEKIDAEYGLESFLELRFEKAYRRFIIPPLRALRDEEGNIRLNSRGRAKGYGACLLDQNNSLSIEVKGMEAVRRDTTELGRRLQLELLELVFSGAGEPAFLEQVRNTIAKLRSGTLDGDLVYRKRLTKAPESYTASTPPQVKAARALGWKGRRGTVEYVWTASGAEPVSAQKSPLDYDHYIEAQILPVAESIAHAMGWQKFLAAIGRGRHHHRRDFEDGQMELEWQDPY
jgi:DNA polymerase-2